MELARERTGVIEARVDYKIVAGIAMWATKNDMPFNSRGELLRTVVELFHQMLVTNKQIVPIQTTEQAIEVLASCGLPFLDRGGRKRAALLKTLTETKVEVADFLESQRISKLAQAIAPEEVSDGTFDLDEDFIAKLANDAKEDS